MKYRVIMILAVLVILNTIYVPSTDRDWVLADVIDEIQSQGGVAFSFAWVSLTMAAFVPMCIVLLAALCKSKGGCVVFSLLCVILLLYVLYLGFRSWNHFFIQEVVGAWLSLIGGIASTICSLLLNDESSY